MIHDEKDLTALAELIAELCEIPRERFAGFAVLAATYKEDGTPCGQIIASTPSLRDIAILVDTAREQLTRDLNRLAGMS